jgi:DNA topoisomerase IB
LHTVFTKAEHAQVNRLGKAFGRERLRYCKEFNRCGGATRARRCSGNASVDI